ncbi:MAG: sialate O-acetylesterase, partial [Muribaculaceae bacterium]|nr:sialate O-acetylesterase [Muribaculaceae bacterium]
MKHSLTRFAAAAALALAGISALNAEVTLPRILSSGMVVQHDRPLTLWGKADPGEKVSVKVNKGKAVSTLADINGDWRIELPALKPGGPYTISVNDLTLSDVLSGDVFLCSGQSNMELPVRRVDDMFIAETSNYSNPSVRQFIVPKEVEFHTPRTDISGGAWTPTTPTS